MASSGTGRQPHFELPKTIVVEPSMSAKQRRGNEHSS